MRFYSRHQTQPGNDSNLQFREAEKEYILSAAFFKDFAVTEILQEGGAHFISVLIEGIQEFRACLQINRVR